MVNYFSLSKLSFVLIVALFAGLSIGCGAASGGFAPGKDMPTVTQPTNPSSNATQNFKYGATTQTSNGWKINYDSSDSVASKTTSNGWKVEVKYE